MRTRISLLLVLLLAPLQSWAYWIRDCHTTHKSNSQVERVADLNPGTPGTVDEMFGFAQIHEHMIAYKGALYFQANDGKTGAELWRVVGDGAPVLVADFVPGPEGSAPHAFTLFEGMLYFAATTPNSGEEIFRTDGTSITLAAESEPGPQGAAISGLTPFKNAIYFTRRGDDPFGDDVWRYANGTVQAVDAINAIPGGIEGIPMLSRNYVVFKNRLYFVLAGPSAEQYQLWAFDGTTPEKIKPLAGEAPVSHTFELGVDTAKGLLYFSVVAGEAPYVDQLWRYDGVTLPVMVKQFDGNATFLPTDFTMYQGLLHFVTDGKLFRIDGNEVYEYPRGPNGTPFWPDHLNVFDSIHQLYMTGWYEDQGYREPHFFDGMGASLIKNIMPDDHENHPGSFPSPAVDIDNVLFFYAADDTAGRELWRVIVKQGVPFLECDIVVAPIWVDRRLWVMEKPEVIVATWRVTADREPELLTRKTLNVKRNKELRVPALKIQSGRDPVAPFALTTVVYNRATGDVLDQGFEIVGTATPELRKQLGAAATRLLQRARKPQLKNGAAGAQRQ